ncbi:hypothetical protein EDD86DRAFT_125359 [Gorgonomyces haynaldii]|nr:hypothetical protein EDD86DRAFT_125359 [Gorgonomyces haynaldii]
MSSYDGYRPPYDQGYPAGQYPNDEQQRPGLPPPGYPPAGFPPGYGMPGYQTGMDMSFNPYPSQSSYPTSQFSSQPAYGSQPQQFVPNSHQAMQPYQASGPSVPPQPYGQHMSPLQDGQSIPLDYGMSKQNGTESFQPPLNPNYQQYGPAPTQAGLHDPSFSQSNASFVQSNQPLSQQTLPYNQQNQSFGGQMPGGQTTGGKSEPDPVLTFGSMPRPAPARYLTPAQVSEISKALHTAFKGFGCDKDAIISLLAKRSPEETVQIAQGYKAAFGQDLVEKIKKETSGHLETLLVNLVTPIPELEAQAFQDAVRGIGTDEELLVEILACKSNIDIANMKQAYLFLYKKDLEKAVANDLSSKELRKFFVALLQGCRDESGTMSSVEQDVKQLYAAGEGRWGHENSVFFQILSTRSYPHLSLVIDGYQKQYGKPFLQAIKSEFSGMLEKVLMQYVSAVSNYPQYLAARFDKTMRFFNTDERRLSSLVARCRDPNLKAAIKAAFEGFRTQDSNTWQTIAYQDQGQDVWTLRNTFACGDAINLHSLPTHHVSRQCTAKYNPVAGSGMDCATACFKRDVTNRVVSPQMTIMASSQPHTIHQLFIKKPRFSNIKTHLG